MGRSAVFLAGLAMGFLGAGALLALLRKHWRREFFFLFGLDEEVSRAESRGARRASRAAVAAVREAGKKILSSSSRGAERAMVRVQVAALSALNQECDTGKSFTFWQRRTSKIQSELEKLREK